MTGRRPNNAGPQTEKHCPVCRQVKPRASFGLRKNGRTLQSYCSECMNANGRKWARENRGRATAKSRAWRKCNREQVRDAASAWRAQNPEKTRAYSKRYYSKNAPEIRSKSKAFKSANRALVRSYENTRRATNTNVRLAHVLRSRLHDALRRGPKRGSAVSLLGCTIDEALSHIEALFQPGMSWENWALDGWHIDHIKPLATFDLTDPRQLAQACHYTNLQPLWARDNQSKGARDCAR